METPEGNIKPQQTGGLKVMTVFVFVLVLHVLVLGGFAAYSLLRPATAEQDVTLDKNHSGAKIVADGSLAGDLPAAPDAAAATDKTAAPATPSTASTTAPAASTPVATAPATTTTPTAPVADTSEPVTVPSAPVADTTSGSSQHGPVIDPPVNLAPVPPSLAAAQTVSPVPPADNAPVGDGAPYLVKKGDSLAKIARQHHVTLAKLKAANSLASDKLHIGQKMVIPNRTQKALATGATPTTPAGVDSISVPTSTPVVTTADADLTAPAAPAPATTPSVKATKKTKALAHTAATPASGHHLYTVVKGDTLTKIARKFKTTPNAIMTANNLTDAGRIGIGKKLRIPAGESHNAAAVAAPMATPAEQPETHSGPKGQLANFVQ